MSQGLYIKKPTTTTKIIIKKVFFKTEIREMRVVTRAMAMAKAMTMPMLVVVVVMPIAF